MKVMRSSGRGGRKVFQTDPNLSVDLIKRNPRSAFDTQCTDLGRSA